MKKIEPFIILVFCVVSSINFNNFLTFKKEYIELKNKKIEHEELVKNIELYKKYEENYNLVFNEGKSLEDKLKDLEKDIKTKNDRVVYYKNSIENMNKKMK